MTPEPHKGGRIVARFTPGDSANGADRDEPDHVRRDFDARVHVEEPARPVIIKPSRFVWRDPATIPLRQWLYGRHLIRKFVSCTLAAGGVGKSTLLLGDALAMATGRALLGHLPQEPLRVWVWNGEDPREELERRVAAICLHYGIAPGEIGDRLFIDSGRELEIVIADMGRSGVRIATPAVDAVREAIVAQKIDALVIDPFVSSHRVTENDNGAIDAVAKAWARIADATGCAIELVHHVRKTGGAEITAEDGRGAVSLIAAARSVRVLNVMSEDEAAKAGVTEHRRTYFRVDNGKANLAPPPEKSEWFHIASQPLGNGGLVDGDYVGVATRWEWPSPLDGLSVSDLRAVQDRIAKGEHAANVQAANWAGLAVAEVLALDADNAVEKARIKSLLRTWIANGALRMETRHNPRTGRDQQFVTSGERV
jgi:hypothetical protein